MEARGGVVALVVLACLVGTCSGVLFSSLQRRLVVTTSPAQGVLKAGEDQITVNWSLNQTLGAGIDREYNKVKVELCYAPISQVDRAWRKTVDDLQKDKTCQFKIVERPYTPSNNSFTWTIERDVPTATYFVRAFVLNTQGHEVAYGQSTDAHKTTNLFGVESITGRHVSLDIASICFSAFSIVSLFVFFYMEKRKAKRSQEK